MSSLMQGYVPQRGEAFMGGAQMLGQALKNSQQYAPDALQKGNFNSSNYWEVSDPREYRKALAEAGVKLSDTEKERLALKEEQYHAVRNRMIGKYPLPGLKRMKQGLDLFGGGIMGLGEISRRNPERFLNLSPAMALSDTWFGGDLSKGYQPPPSPEGLMSGLANQYLTQAGRLAGLENNFLTGQLTNSKGQAIQATGGSSTESGFDPERPPPSTAGLTPYQIEQLKRQARKEEQDKLNREEDKVAGYRKEIKSYGSAVDYKVNEMVTSFSQLEPILKNLPDADFPGGFEIPFTNGRTVKFTDWDNFTADSEVGNRMKNLVKSIQSSLNNEKFGGNMTGHELKQSVGRFGERWQQSPSVFRQSLSDVRQALENHLKFLRGTHLSPGARELMDSDSGIPNLVEKIEGLDFQYGPDESRQKKISTPGDSEAARTLGEKIKARRKAKQK